MKLEIGETWHREGDGYVEELTVEGLESIDDQIPEGETVLPKNGDSLIEVRIINSVSEDFHYHEIPLRNLVDKWEQGEADI